MTLQNFHKKSFLTISITGFSTILFFLWLQFTGQHQTPINNWTSLISGIIFLISSIICFIYYKKIGDRGGVSTTILATGIANFLYFIGAVIWSYDNIVKGIEVPYPSIGDVFFILMIIIYAFAVGSLLKIYKSSTKISTFVMALVVFLILGVITFSTVGKPEISQELSFWENFFNFTYSLGDSIYVGAGIALLIIAGGKIYKGILTWVAGMLLTMAADLTFTYRAALGVVWNGDIADQLYVLSAIAFTYAVILLAKMTDQSKIELES